MDGRSGTQRADDLHRTDRGDRGDPTEGIRPLIGVTGYRHRCDGSTSSLVAAGEAYLTAVCAAGGLPVILAPVDAPEEIAAVFDRVDGLLFTGGRDIDPRHFGEAVYNKTVRLEPDRDAFELPLARAAVAGDVPVLAICRGCQVLNVALGGSLWQDLPAQRPHCLPHSQQAPRDAVSHAVRLEPHTLLAAILGQGVATPLATNSFHHQAARDLPAWLIAAAYAADGTVEAIEAPERTFVLGVQWHPEHLAATQPGHQRIFTAFVNAAAATHRRRRLAGPKEEPNDGRRAAGMGSPSPHRQGG